MKKKPALLSPGRILAAGFLGIILAGALLLSLPFANRTGRPLPFLDCLFTSTSATCVTGLVAADTWTQFNGLGQLILLVLIQVGGLGYMTMVLMASMLLGRKISLRQRDLMLESVSAERLSDVYVLLRYILRGTAAIECAGAALLAFRFVPELGWGRGLWYSVFHSVSAFCNAGFDLMGFREPYSSLTHYADDPLVNLTVCALVLLGGLGFLVWREVWEKGPRLRRYTLHAKIMLSATLILTLGGAILFWLAERDNLLSGMAPGEQALASLFQAVSPRTAGFNTVDLARLTSAGGLLTIALMFIGAGPGSTGGGVPAHPHRLYPGQAGGGRVQPAAGRGPDPPGRGGRYFIYNPGPGRGLPAAGPPALPPPGRPVRGVLRHEHRGPVHRDHPGAVLPEPAGDHRHDVLRAAGQPVHHDGPGGASAAPGEGPGGADHHRLTAVSQTCPVPPDDSCSPSCPRPAGRHL